MVLYALGTFAAGATLGLIMASMVLRGKFAPWAVSLIHAALGATGLYLVLATVLHFGKSGGQTSSQLIMAAILFLLAAPGGLFLASYHLRKKIPPKAAVFLHAGLAVTGFVTLLILALT
jgi:hypothetical protein